MDLDALVNLAINFWAPAQYIFMGLGALVVIGMAVDAAIPDEYDHGFMAKIFAIPFVGAFLKYIAKFSPFNKK